jgi:hypothetical protein
VTRDEKQVEGATMKQVSFQYSATADPDLAIGEIRQLRIPTQADSYFVVRGLIGSFGGSLTLQFSDDGTGMNWSSDAVRENNTLGTAQLPLVTLEPIVIPPTSTILIRAQNLAGVANPVQLVLDGYKHYDLGNPPIPQQLVQPSGRRKRWFQYIVDKQLAAFNRDTAQVKIQADSTFTWQEIVVVSTGAFRVKVTDSGSGRIYMDAFIRNVNWAGTAQFPKLLRPAVQLAPASTVQYELEDLSGAANTIQVAMIGYKTFLVS